MPTVGSGKSKKSFPYTPKGKKEAKEAMEGMKSDKKMPPWLKKKK